MQLIFTYNHSLKKPIALWDHGVDTYDASTRTNFKLRAAAPFFGWFMTSQHMEIYLDIALRGGWFVLFVKIKLVRCGYQRVKKFATWAIDDFFLKTINGEKIKHL